MKRLLITLLGMAFCLHTCMGLAGCQRQTVPPAAPFALERTSVHDGSPKSVIVIMIDSMMDKPLQNAIRQGEVPALSYLMDRGWYEPAFVAPFPTMSVTIESSLLTGTGPDRHHVPGLVWYDKRENRIVSYGTGWRDLLQQGLGQVLDDSLRHLNHTHLSRETPTLYEELEERGYSSASINGLIFRGRSSHTLRLPPALADAAGMPREMPAKAPPYFSMGVLSRISPNNIPNTRLWDQYGMNDKFAAEELMHLIRNGQLPDFSLVYLSDNDHAVHMNGPKETSGIRDADRQLQRILDTFPSWEEGVRQAIWIVMGDSGQAAIGSDRDQALIPVVGRLKGYRVTQGSRPLAQDDLVVCLNERMAFLYALHRDVRLPAVAGQLAKEPRIDLLAWTEGDEVVVVGQSEEQDQGRGTGQRSKAAKGKASGRQQRPELRFRTGGPLTDSYGQAWTVKGDPGALDLKLDSGTGSIRFGRYPDALSRLHSILHSHEGPFMVVTAQPGAQLDDGRYPRHLGGGGHGGLHRDESLIPVLAVGVRTRPDHNRVVDLRSWLLGLATTPNRP